MIQILSRTLRDVLLVYLLLAASGCRVTLFEQHNSRTADRSAFTLRSARVDPAGKTRALARRVVLFVPGLYNEPGDITAWTERACRWVGVNLSGVAADRLEYASGAVFHAGQSRHAADLASVVAEYQRGGLQVAVVAHSNGALVACRAVGMLPDGTNVEVLRLLAGAAEADWHVNGLNNAMTFGQVNRVEVFNAGRDRVIGLWARVSRWPPWGWLPGWRFGTLGADGPQNVREGLVRRVSLYLDADYGHQDYWMPENFPVTMMRVTPP